MKPRLKSRLKLLLPVLLVDESREVEAASAANRNRFIEIMSMPTFGTK